MCECAAGYQPDFFVEIQGSSAQCESDIAVDKAKTLQACKHMCHMFTEPYSGDFTDGIAIPEVIQSQPFYGCYVEDSTESSSKDDWKFWDGDTIKALQEATCQHGITINTRTE